MRNIDLSLCLVTDSDQARAAGHDLVDIVRAACANGVTTVQIREHFVNLQITEKVDPITGERTRTKQIIFPRFHQWEAVTSLLDTTRVEGAGSKYLIQHSAG